MFYLTTHSTHCRYGYMVKEGKYGLFNDALNTLHLRLYRIRNMVTEGSKCFILTTHSTHSIYGYIASGIWLKKEANVLFNDTLNTSYLRLYGIRHMLKKEGMVYLTTHSTQCIYGYIASGIW